ncbi:hypothetical protein [Bradyrhizobium sp.]|uniref:hypothetical protein n=1 Tax=Bradyrhizobium sp. TaxID=376 RepID=UPI0039E31721
MLTRLLRMLPSSTIEGYEHPELVSEIFAKTVAAEPAGEWPEVRGAETVLDFGGACGIHYKLARREAPLIRWAVVETPAMVRQAAQLETDRLRFFETVEAAASWLGTIDLMHSNGAVQYTAKPSETVRQLAGVGATRMHWKRLFFSDQPIAERQRSMLIENGPRTDGRRLRFTTKAVSYDRKSLSRAEFEAAHSGYRAEASGPDWFNFVKASE